MLTVTAEPTPVERWPIADFEGETWDVVVACPHEAMATTVLIAAKVTVGGEALTPEQAAEAVARGLEAVKRAQRQAFLRLADCPCGDRYAIEQAPPHRPRPERFSTN